MNKIKYIFGFIAVALFASCGTVKNSSVFRPDNVRLEINMDDLNYLGETEVSVTYDTYLGIFRSIDKINGEDYNSLDKKKVSLNMQGGLLEGPINQAAYKVLETYPKASYFIPVCKTTVKNRLFLGSEVTVTATIRAYSFK